mgnify:CR=1 FL=1
MPGTYFKKVCRKHPELNGERRKENRSCIGCLKDYKAGYRAKNKELIAARFKDWLGKNKEKRAAYCKAWGERNKEWWLTYNKNQYATEKEVRAVKLAVWRKENPDRVRATATMHAVLRKRLIGGQAIARTFANETSTIYRNCPDGHEVDHIVPLRGKTVNGLHVPWNLQYLPMKENRSKGNRWQQ